MEMEYGDDDTMYRVPTRGYANKKPIIQRGGDDRCSIESSRQKIIREKNASSFPMGVRIRDVRNGARYTTARDIKWSFIQPRLVKRCDAVITRTA